MSCRPDRILRSGCRVGMRSSGSTWLNSDPVTWSDPRIATSVHAVEAMNMSAMGVEAGVFQRPAGWLGPKEEMFEIAFALFTAL